VAFGLGRFVAVGDGGVIITSTNSGQDWQALQFPSSIYFTRVNFANGQFFATGRQFGDQLGSFEGLLWSSADGVNWVPRYAAENAVVWGVAYGASRYIAIAVDAPSNTARALSSFDGTQWTSTVIPGNGWLYDITFGNGVFVAVGGTRAMRSADGTAWLAASLPVISTPQAIEFFNGAFVAVGGMGQILTSSDGAAWTTRSSGTTRFLAAVAVGHDGVAAAGDNGIILFSPDGIDWTTRFEGGTDLRGLAFGADHYVAVGRYGSAYLSGPLSACVGSRLAIRFGQPTQIDLFGETGATYLIEFADQPGTMGWQTLQQVVVSSSPHTVADPNPSPTGRRFYRALRVP